MQSYYVGLDVHSKESVFVIEDHSGASVARGTIATTPAGLARLREQYGLGAGTPVALESGASAFFVARASSNGWRWNRV